MYNIIERFMSKLSKNQVNDFAIKNNVILSEDELNFTYEFVVKNWSELIGNPGRLDIDKYKNKFSEENFIKVKKLINEYMIKFQGFL